MTSIADRLDLDKRDFPELNPEDGALGKAMQLREVLSPLFNFTLNGDLVIHHINNGIGEKITTEQFIYFIIILLNPVLDNYIATIGSIIQGKTHTYTKHRGVVDRTGKPVDKDVIAEHELICSILQTKLNRIKEFRSSVGHINNVKSILDYMVIVLQGESYWDKFVDIEEDEEEEAEEEERVTTAKRNINAPKEVFIKEISTTRNKTS